MDWYCRKEQAVHLDDVLRRRAGWGLYLPAGERRVEEVARWMGEVLGWDDAARAGEIAALPR